MFNKCILPRIYIFLLFGELYYGIDFPHEKGEWTERNIFDYYCVCCFATPFLYETGGKFEKGNEGDVLIMEPGKLFIRVRAIAVIAAL